MWGNAESRPDRLSRSVIVGTHIAGAQAKRSRRGQEKPEGVEQAEARSKGVTLYLASDRAHDGGKLGSRLLAPLRLFDGTQVVPLLGRSLPDGGWIIRLLSGILD